MNRLQLELYVVGHSVRSQAAVDNLRRICETRVPGQFDLQIIDILEQPQAAEDSNIMATPTLIKRAPAPVRRLLGDLSLTETVLRGLGLDDTDWKEGHHGD
ncbi:MAG: circadian clock KaiB family protein [Polyangiales bacterium]